MKTNSCPKEIDCPKPKKVLLPEVGLEDLGTRVVRWSDLDGNGHLFSGKYGDIIWDVLPEDLKEQIPSVFFINYCKEALMDEALHLRGFRKDNSYLMEGLGAHGICFTALCEF